MQCSSALAGALFALGLLGVIVRRNVLVMLMCMELMLNGVNLCLVMFAQQNGSIARRACWCSWSSSSRPPKSRIAIPIVLLLARRSTRSISTPITELKG